MFTNFEMSLIYPPTSLWFLGRLIFQFPPKVSNFDHFRKCYCFFAPMSKQFHVSETFENRDPVLISKLISWFQHNKLVKKWKSQKKQHQHLQISYGKHEGQIDSIEKLLCCSKVKSDLPDASKWGKLLQL